MLLSRCLNGKPLFCGRQIIKNILRGCSTNTNVQGTAIENNGNKNNLMKSRVYPGFEIVYAFPGIRYISLFNLGKTISTVFSSVGSLSTYILYVTNVIPYDIAEQFTGTFLLATMWFHIGGLIFNNFVGAIYVKEDNENIIISYVNYWGKRKNLMVDPMLIVSLEEVSPNIMKIMYKKLYIIQESGRWRLFKIYLGNTGTIINEDKLKSIIGTWQ